MHMNCRALLSAALLVLLTLQILPCSFREPPMAATGGGGGLACRFEPLQVCDDDSSLLGAWSGTPVLLAAAPVVFPSREVRALGPERTVCLPDGFKPLIERPPRRPA